VIVKDGEIIGPGTESCPSDRLPWDQRKSVSVTAAIDEWSRVRKKITIHNAFPDRWFTP
jgi:hypothetical protein